MRRVLLIEEGWSQTGYLARALAATGLGVRVLTANGSARSHHRHGVAWTSAAPVPSPRFLAQVDDVVTAGDFDHVWPLTEAAMARLWDAAPPWAARLYPGTERWQRALLRDKHALIEHMAARGIAVPRQRRLDLTPGGALDLATFAAIGRELGWPLVVKPATGYAGVGVQIVDGAMALARAVAAARAAGGAWVAQEHLAGPTYLVGGLFDAGRALRVYAAEKVEQYPARTGPAIRLRSDADAALTGVALQVFAELRWTGLASADLIRGGDGRPVLLEINPRPWASIAIARRAGVDLFTPLAALLAGHAPLPDLTFTADQDCLVFPRYLLSPAYRRTRGLARAVRDLLGDAGRDWRHPRLIVHNLLRLHGLRHQWRLR